MTRRRLTRGYEAFAVIRRPLRVLPDASHAPPMVSWPGSDVEGASQSSPGHSGQSPDPRGCPEHEATADRPQDSKPARVADVMRNSSGQDGRRELCGDRRTRPNRAEAAGR